MLEHHLCLRIPRNWHRNGGHGSSGLAVSIDEVSSSGHRDDTISAGGESTDKVAAAGFVENLSAFLQNWKVWIGSPPPRRRVTSCSSGCRTQHAENDRQEMRLTKYHPYSRRTGDEERVVRRSDIQVMSLVMDGKQEGV